jgi:hypothetical protein
MVEMPVGVDDVFDFASGFMDFFVCGTSCGFTDKCVEEYHAPICFDPPTARYFHFCSIDIWYGIVKFGRGLIAQELNGFERRHENTSSNFKYGFVVALMF